MADVDLAGLITPGTIGIVGVGLAGFGKWALNLWATVRREGIVAAAAAALQRQTFETQAAALQRADNARMVDALLAQARSSTELAAAHASLAGKIDQLSTKLDTAKIDQLSSKLDTIAKNREWTPVHGFDRVEPSSLESERTRITRERHPDGMRALPVPEPLPEVTPSAPYHFKNKRPR